MLRSTHEEHDQVDPAEALMREVGAQLRQVRLERGEDLEEVAQYLRIKPTYLFGIEQGDLSGMPGRTYALGFLRSYADYLGFDGEDLIVRIKSTVAELTDKTRFTIRAPLPENRLPKAPLFVVSVALLAGIYVGWSFFNDRGEQSAAPVPPVPEELKQLIPVPRSEAEMGAGGPMVPDPNDPATRTATPQHETSVAPTSETASSPADGAASDQAGSAAAPDAVAQVPGQPMATEAAPPGVPVGEAASDLQPHAGPEPIVQARAAQPPDPEGSPTHVGQSEVANGPTEVERASAEAVAGAPGEDAPGTAGPARILAALAPIEGTVDDSPPIYDSEHADARVIIRARSSSWIRISSFDGDYLRSRTLEPGEAILVPDRPDLELWTGNAGGLELIVDGVPTPALGREGQVMRNVSLDPERLLANSAGRP